MGNYTARLTKSGVNSFAVEFRHPILKDREGKQGRKIRRGLGTNQDEAKKVVDDLNLLLADESYWSLNEQQRAIGDFKEKAIEIFYDQMEEDILQDPLDLRENFIAMPSKHDGFSRIMFLGTTGAGKTTVIRQMIGTEPDEISFPAISSSRTTTCNTEFIFCDGRWKAVVTFISQSQAIRLVEECIWEAFRRAVIGEDEKTIAKALLSHPEQRFRLSYFLGQYRTPGKQVTKAFTNEQTVDVPYPDQQSLQSDLNYIIGEVQQLASEALAEFPTDEENIDEVIDLLYEVWIREDTERFNELVQHILKLIKSRLQVIHLGRMYRDTRGWPIFWTHESEEKSEVINMMRWFAGNEGRRFGQLLAPIVNGIRLQGPFQPHWWPNETSPRLVLIDGEGIGHDSNITTSLPLEVTNRFKDVDGIVLVDNATQPMLDIPKVILRDAAARGQQEKLMVVYTRFDQVEGSNMIDDDERLDHVLGIQNGAVEAMQEAYNLNAKMIRQLRDHLENNTFFFPNTNELKNPPFELQAEMGRFIETAECKVQNLLPNGVVPVPEYDFGRLVLVISETEELFMQKWLGLLGLRTSQFQKQPWARIKALTNRMANWSNVISYKDLEPASDLAGYLIQRLNEFLNVPKGWTVVASEEEMQSVIRNLSGYVSDRINELIVRRLKVDHHAQWIVAYLYRGSGSAAQRASEIRSIMEKTIPQPKITYDRSSGDLLDEIKELIVDSISLLKQEAEKVS